MPSRDTAFPLFHVASNFSATTDIRVGSSFGITGEGSPGVAGVRVQVVVGTACAISLITKTLASSVLASARLIPKTSSAAMSAAVLYVFNHAIHNSCLYNYQLDTATTSVLLQVDRIDHGQSFE